jgi:DNA polymerase III sliding clamp (beta) subunit (PCNA family)
MKFTVETTQLKEALKRLGFAVNGKSIMPALTNILVTVTKGEILLTSTDLMTTISYRIECSTDGEGQFLMPYEQSKNIIALEQGDVQVMCTKGHVSMKFEADNFSLGNGGDVADFPKIPTVPKKGMVDFDKSLVQALSMARSTMSLALYYQIIGRAMRPHPSKQSSWFVDLGGNVKQFGKIETMQIRENEAGLMSIWNNGKQLTNVNFTKN